MLNKPLRLKENVSDALRNTLAVVLPLLLFYHTNRQAAIAMAVGALLISLTDLPGNRKSKAGSALQSLTIFFVVSLIFSATLNSSVLTGLVLVAFTFWLSMLAAFGGRSGVAGTMGIILMVFMLGLRPHEPLLFSAYLLMGCTWFYLISLIQVFLFPYRSLHQALNEAGATTIEFLKVKANCYNLSIALDESYRRLIGLHLKVSDKQELVRQLLLSDHYAMRDRKPNVKRLLAATVNVINLYEQVTAMHYDYAVVRERLAPTGAMPLLAAMIRNTAEGRRAEGDFQALEMLAKTLSKEDAAVIKGVLTNVAAIKRLMGGGSGDNEIPSDLGAFLPVRANYLQKLISQLHWRSHVLRFALRLSLLFALGYAATQFFARDNYSYWLLLTVVIVARPKLAVTWQRNLERLAGTFAGVIIAIILVFVIKAAVPLLIIAAFALLGFFAWNRPKYGWSVGCITVCVLICLNLYRGEPMVILSARIWYSLAGCALAFTGIFIFPVWINSELDDLAHAAVAGNASFLQTLIVDQEQQQVWLARKEAHLKLARLSEGIRHARVEPGKVDLPKLEHVQILNYRINAVIISLFLSGRRVDLSSAQKAWRNLQAYINRVQMPIVNHQPTNLLKGQDLLLYLTAELASLAQPASN